MSRAGVLTDREVGDLLLRACHDLRTTVRAIGLYAELLQREQDAVRSPDFQRRLSFIAEGARKASLLVDGLTSYSIALQMETAFHKAPMDVLLRNVLAKLARELRENGAVVTSGELPVVEGNQDRLMEVFENLLRNALVHRGEAPPRIEVTAEKQPGEWRFRVRDNGPGVDARYLESIFEPFERLRGADRPGPGLGLAVSRAIVERHGGTIWAESTPGAGCSFLFTLPAE
jgi:signal transduction histidine kinase